MQERFGGGLHEFGAAEFGVRTIDSSAGFGRSEGNVLFLGPLNFLRALNFQLSHTADGCALDDSRLTALFCEIFQGHFLQDGRMPVRGVFLHRDKILFRPFLQALFAESIVQGAWSARMKFKGMSQRCLSSQSTAVPLRQRAFHPVAVNAAGIERESTCIS